MARQSRADKFNNTNGRKNTKGKSNNSNPRQGYGSYQDRNDKATFKPMTEGQRALASSIRANILTFAAGVAGSGKSHTSIHVGCEMMLKGLVENIICLKPSIEIDNSLGTLPGDKDEKLHVLYNPMRQLLIKILGKSHFENLFNSEKIVFEHLGSILGVNYENAVIIIDEAQHATPDQMKVLLMRLGKNSRIVVCGDYKEQRFYKAGTHGMSGMEDALIRFRHQPNVGVVEFTVDDIVRHDFTKQAILSYREDINFYLKNDIPDFLNKSARLNNDDRELVSSSDRLIF